MTLSVRTLGTDDPNQGDRHMSDDHTTDDTTDGIDDTGAVDRTTSDETDKPGTKVTPIWSRLEKLLERGESATSAAMPSPTLDIAAILEKQIEIECKALELSRLERIYKGVVIKSPPNVVLARQLSEYIRSRIGLPAMDGVRPS